MATLEEAKAISKQKSADFWGKAGDWWGGITGGTQKKAGQAQMAQAGQVAGGIAGTTEQQQMQNAQTAAAPLAEQQGQIAATQGSRAALQAARTSGLNAGQAALTSGQQAGDIYTGAYQGGLESGMNRYGQATGQRLAAAGQQGALGQAQQQAGQAQGKALWGGIKDVAGFAGGLISDENAKENIQPAPDMLDTILRKVRPKTFDYKPGVGDPGPQVGVVAQDLEKTPLAPVVEETPTGKVINTGKLSTAALDLILELGQRVKELEGK
ncbi:MAG TPA: tail fiber domain-containing protein [Candidatus Paceibacterota bacterium]|nr:tail fiber domain-containing protein [Candidatus Paceibacterota bacterium]